MRIGQLAKRTGLSISRIRFYETTGVLPQASREANGYRNYPEEAVAMLQFVDRAQSIGFSLSEIRERKPDGGLTLPAPSSILAALEQKDKEIDRLIEEAEAKKAAIAAMLDELQCTS